MNPLYFKPNREEPPTFPTSFLCNMEGQRSSFLAWSHLLQGKTIEELRHSLLYTTVELEQTKMAVEEELKKRDDQLFQLKDFLNKTIQERDEAQEKCHRFLLEKLLLQQQAAPLLSGVSSVEDEPRRGIESNNGLSASDSDDSIVSSPVLPPQTVVPDVVPEKPLPEKGKLLQAVMQAGPLLQTLLLAGPLPQWRHPPPPLESFEIPPVTIHSPSPSPPLSLQQDSINGVGNCGRVDRKRAGFDGSDSPTGGTKHQRVVLH